MGFRLFFCCGADSDRSEKGKKNSTGWRIFSLKELQSATNNFNYDNKLGEGGFGSVYWGQLWDGSQIAVKRLKVWRNEDEMDFAVEVEILGRVRHKNLLNLRGYCAEGQERLIVYDYMPNLSLLSHLRGQHSAECLLDWARRMNIAIGSAEGIAYLHHHATPHIIHTHIKPSNVLLDSDFQARVADFGYTNLVPDRIAPDNRDYIAPERAVKGEASKSCDVYSFGLLLLELASGKKPTDKSSSAVKRTVTDWAMPLARERQFEEMADPRLSEGYVKDELKRMVIVALACTQDDPHKRPTMLEVVELLKGESKEKLHGLENSGMFNAEETENRQMDGQDVIHEAESTAEVSSDR